jgi:hypothetical protein
VGATPDRSLARACSRSVPTIPRGIGTGAFPKPSSLRAPGGGSPDFGGLAFRAFLPAKSSVLPAGCYTAPGPWPSWGSPLQGSLASGGGRHLSLPPSPLGLRRPRPESPPGQSPAPQGFACLDGWALLLRDAPALMRFSTLSILSLGPTVRSPLAAADGSRRSFRFAGPSASPRTPGLRRRSPAGPLRGDPSSLACAPRERTSR